MTQIRTFINREASGHEGWHEDVTWLVTTALGVFQHLPTLLAQRLKIPGQIPGPTNGVWRAVQAGAAVTHSWHGMGAGEGQCHGPKGTCAPGLRVEVRLGGPRLHHPLGFPALGLVLSSPEGGRPCQPGVTGISRAMAYLLQPCPGHDGS